MLKFFLGPGKQEENNIFVSQPRKSTGLLKRFNTSNWNEMETLMNLNKKLQFEYSDERWNNNFMSTQSKLKTYSTIKIIRVNRESESDGKIDVLCKEYEIIH